MLAGFIKFLHSGIILMTPLMTLITSPCKQLWKMSQSLQTQAWMTTGGTDLVHQTLVSLSIARMLALLPLA